MQAISKVLTQQTHLDIFGCSTFTKIDLKGWIANQDYYIDDPLSINEFVLRSGNRNNLMNALANDCNRMAIAAIETICGVVEEPTLKQSSAWGIVRSYYASFFAVHSILRMFGISCSQIEQTHTNKIFESAKLFNNEGGLTKLDKGFYLIKIDKHFNKVSFSKIKDSHKDTWSSFLSLLDKLIDNSPHVTALTTHKSEIIDLLRNIKRGITRSHCTHKGNWLSVMRNSVNYQHTYGAWFPYEGKSKAKDYILRASENWKESPDHFNIDYRLSDVEIFFEVCQLINSFFGELIVSCVKKGANTNKIFSNGSLKLLHTIHAV